MHTRVIGIHEKPKQFLFPITFIAFYIDITFVTPVSHLADICGLYSAHVLLCHFALTPQVQGQNCQPAVNPNWRKT